MKLLKFDAVKLQGRMKCNIAFNEDINIITGQNGSGKTTILKVIWYMISGNLERIHLEVDFEKLYIKTTAYELILVNKEESVVEITTIIKKDIQSHLFQKIDNICLNPSKRIKNIDSINRMIVDISNGSVFFPTFRRIEGGFSLTENNFLQYRTRMLGDEIQANLASLSSMLSVDENYFIASISTHDITDLLRRKHSEASEEVNSLHIAMSNFIEEKISSMNKNTPTKQKDNIINEIQEEVAYIKKKRESLLLSFTRLSELVSELYQNRGIKFTEKFSVGETEQAISSAKLSAGEKQLLSFICYNSFCRSVPFIIDEPELSLHVDWQRNLLPILKSQKTDNQIIIATHSPFIYSKYPEKEIIIT